MRNEGKPSRIKIWLVPATWYIVSYPSAGDVADNMSDLSSTGRHPAQPVPVPILQSQRDTTSVVTFPTNYRIRQVNEQSKTRTARKRSW